MLFICRWYMGFAKWKTCKKSNKTWWTLFKRLDGYLYPFLRNKTLGGGDWKRDFPICGTAPEKALGSRHRLHNRSSRVSSMRSTTPMFAHKLRNTRTQSWAPWTACSSTSTCPTAPAPGTASRWWCGSMAEGLPLGTPAGKIALGCGWLP